LLTMWLI